MIYKVGQILYILSKKNAGAIIPVQVVEQVTHKKMSGEEIAYIVTPFNDQTKEFELSNIVGEIYSDLNSLRETMLSRTTTTIDGVILKATENAKNFKQQKSSDLPQESKDDNGALTHKPEEPSRQLCGETQHSVKLPDGTVAHIRHG